MDFIENRATDIVHIEPLTAGGIRGNQAHRGPGGDAEHSHRRALPASRRWAPSRMSMPSPPSATSSGSSGTTSTSISPWWQELITGISKPMIQNGYITVPEKPGLGVELNEEVVRQAPARSRLLRAHPAVRQVHSDRLLARRAGKIACGIDRGARKSACATPVRRAA